MVPLSLSIKDVPDALAARLRERAARNHRSLQRELMAIVEAAAADAQVHGQHAASTVLTAASTVPVYAVVQRQRPARAPADGDALLDELDAIVAGSQWGRAPLLTRERASDRRLMRETEYDTQETVRRGAAPFAGAGDRGDA